MKKGIYLVANYKSQEMCKNLIYSIRESGCDLPIRLIHFGGKEIDSQYILKEVEFLHYESFSEKAKEFVESLRTVLTDCPLGFLYRFLGWFSDWDAFIYSDNDIVALSNWKHMFDYLNEYDLVHADEEYTTEGIFNYYQPDRIKAFFGHDALQTALTAGHFVVKPKASMIEDMQSAIEWFKQYPDIPKKHDQSLLHVATLLGQWQILNLCRVKNWLSSWAGDYRNTLDIIQKIQTKNATISHLHYSGGTPNGDAAIQELLLSTKNDKDRLRKLSILGLTSFFGSEKVKKQFLRAKRFMNRKFIKKKQTKSIILPIGNS